jgi:hypothetical protein
LGFCILNREDREDRKKNMLAHLAAVMLDRARLLTYIKLSGSSIGYFANWEVTRIKDRILHIIWQKR